MKLADRVTLFERFQAVNPNPTTELNYHSTFELLIAVMLSAQATDVSVNKVTQKLFLIAHTPQQLLALGEAGLIEYIKTLGLFRSKTRHVLQTCEILLRDHNGEVPSTRLALEKLPGVGRKTANVVLNCAFGAPTIAVDTHIFRVSNRLGLARGKTPLEVELKLEKAVPKAFKQHCHHWLILHGRYTCKARKPDCAHCLVNDLCAQKIE